MTIREEALAKLIEECSALFDIDTENLGEETRFDEDLQMKSLVMTTLLNRLEDEFDVELPYMKVRRCATLGDAADFIADKFDE